MSYYSNSATAGGAGAENAAAYNGYAGEGYTFYDGSASQAAAPQTRTIAIHGFPSNLRERELNNLLLFLPGYQASVLSWDETEVKGHALFANAALAQQALSRIDGRVEFDSGCVLRAELAPEDLHVDANQIKRHADDFAVAAAAVSAASMPASTSTQMAASPPTLPPYMTPGPGGAVPYPAAYGYAPAAVAVAAPPPALATPQRSYAPVKNDKDNPPCNTLFIGNLGEGVDENELRAVFGTLPGFQQVKVVHGPRGVSAFIEFADVSTAAACHQTQQGLLLTTSDRGPIRVQYSKNPFGRKRDAAGNALAGLAPAAGGAAPGAYAAYALPMAQPMQPLMQAAYGPGLMYTA